MDRQRYIEEGYRQLSDTSVYIRTHSTAISDFEEDIQRLADQLHIERVITDDIRQLAIRINTKSANANIVMSIFERKLLTVSCNKQLVRFRYIDDIFAIWKYGEDKFKDYTRYINDINSSFQHLVWSAFEGP